MRIGLSPVGSPITAARPSGRPASANARAPAMELSSSQVAIVYADGAIVDGDGTGKDVYGNTLAEKLARVRRNDKVRAVVLRVNSPGGSALASDVIWREMELLRAEKPVIVSMGAYAASGGYYISCPADVIVADRMTLTGSIGVVTGKLVSTHSETSLSSALTRLIAKQGEPVIRKGVDLAMRMLGKQFVTGETIDEALANGREREARGYRFSYDMLGEAAMTEADAQRYLADYEMAIHAIGKASAGRGVYEGPGISVKLSAIHPRYSRAQRDRVMNELLPRLKKLLVLAKQYNIGLNIDAEEADRMELSLDLLEALAFDPELAGWNGIGLVVQAYQKRCPYIIDHLIDLARRSHHRFMVRLVKGDRKSVV